MANFAIFQRGGQPGRVAINPDQVTDVRSSVGLFTDICFGESRVTVEGKFEEVIDRLSDGGKPPSNSGQKVEWSKRPAISDVE